MAPFLILVIASVLLRGIGWLEIGGLRSWMTSVRLALVCMFVFTGATHFSIMKYDYAAMVPELLPKDLWIIYLTGLLEIAGAAGLLVPRLRQTAARSGPRNLDSGLSGISIVFQAAVPKPVVPKYTTSGVRRPSEL